MAIGNDVRAIKLFDHRNDALEFFFDGNIVRTRPGRFAADVEHIGALFCQAQAVSDRGFEIGKLAAIRKRIRRHVDDADHARTIERQRAAGNQALWQTDPWTCSLTPRHRAGP
jgi:hypothetical protein